MLTVNDVNILVSIFFFRGGEGGATLPAASSPRSYATGEWQE